MTAVALAVLGVVMFAVMVVLGSRLGWVIELPGQSERGAEFSDLRGELPWMSMLLVGVLVGALLDAKRPRNPIP